MGIKPMRNRNAVPANFHIRARHESQSFAV